MMVYFNWDGDSIGNTIGRGYMADKPDDVRRISQAIELGNKIWSSWVTMNGGSIISCGGDEGAAEIPAEHLMELPKIRTQYAGAVGATVSIGVGTKLSESSRALMAAKLQGKDKIVFWTPEVDKLIEEVQKERGPKDEADKLSEAYLQDNSTLNKAAPGANQGAGAGFGGKTQPGRPKTDAPSQGAEEHSQGEAAQAQADAGPAPAEATASAEDQFHQAALDQQGKEQGQPPAPGSNQDQVRAQIVQTLQNLKAQMPIMEQIKGTAPDTYQAVMGLAQAVIMMARQMNGDDPNQQAPREMQDRASSDAQVQVPQPPEEGEESASKDKKSKDSASKDKKSKDSSTKKSEKAYKLEGDALIEVNPRTGKSLGLGPVNEDAKKGEKKPEESWHNCEEHGHCWGEGLTGEHCLICGENQADLDKASLSPNIGQSPAEHHHLQLPVGSQKDTGPEMTRDAGKIKIQHVDNGQPGKQGWASVRAGQVLSADGHATSALNPTGK